VPEQNCYVCPEGKQLKYMGINQLNRTHVYHSTLKRCRDCSQKSQCTRGKFRILSIHTCEPARQRAYALAKTPAFAQSQRDRPKVEALFAELISTSLALFRAQAVAASGVGLKLRNRTSRLRFCTVAAR
jgi:hypothetical protein